MPRCILLQPQSSRTAARGVLLRQLSLSPRHPPNKTGPQQQETCRRDPKPPEHKAGSWVAFRWHHVTAPRAALPPVPLILGSKETTKLQLTGGGVSRASRAESSSLGAAGQF